jgi:hypothetical protein
MSEELQSSYDRVAENYAKQFRDEMDKKPFDRKMLDWLAEKAGSLGVICYMGCGTRTDSPLFTQSRSRGLRY